MTCLGSCYGTTYLLGIPESRYVQCARKCMRCHWLRIYWTPTKYLGKQIARLQMMVTMQPVLRFRRKLSSMHAWHGSSSFHPKILKQLVVFFYYCTRAIINCSWTLTVNKARILRKKSWDIDETTSKLWAALLGPKGRLSWSYSFKSLWLIKSWFTSNSIWILGHMIMN